MHVLARGDILQRLRLASGLVLFTFAATHFLNHALGLVSLEAMQGMQDWRKVVTRSWPGRSCCWRPCSPTSRSALYKLARRATWRLPSWERRRSSGPLHPVPSAPAHRQQPRVAHVLVGTEDNYAFELAQLWPAAPPCRARCC